MAARKKSAPANRRATSAKSILTNLPRVSNSRGGLNFRSITNMPAVRYIAGGLALYGIVRLAMKTMDSYPQIGEFFSENLDSVEGKFREWTGRESESIADNAH